MNKAAKKLADLGIALIVMGIILTQKDTILTFISKYLNFNYFNWADFNTISAFGTFITINSYGSA